MQNALITMKAEGLDEVRSACRFAARLQKKAEGLDEVNYALITMHYALRIPRLEGSTSFVLS